MSGIRHSYLGIGEAAEILGVTRQQAFNLRKAGALRAVRREVFLRGDVEKLVRQRAEREERRQKKRTLREKLRAARLKIVEEGKSDVRPGGVPGTSRPNK